MGGKDTKYKTSNVLDQNWKTAMINNVETDKNADQLAREFMSTLAAGDMDTLMTFWADDGILEFPFHPPGTIDRVEGKQAISKYFKGTKGHKKPTSFPIKASYLLEGGNGVVLEFDGNLTNLKTGEQYANSYIVVFKFRNSKLILFREFFDSLKRQKYETQE